CLLIILYQINGIDFQHFNGAHDSFYIMNMFRTKSAAEKSLLKLSGWRFFALSKIEKPEPRCALLSNEAVLTRMVGKLPCSGISGSRNLLVPERLFLCGKIL
ncbi:MAG: hypothetical protein LJE96_03055, partial [Deltaproteobacteria bacterium]|nr:hypothetical protein [Deltaproteobacteria bacterium]